MTYLYLSDEDYIIILNSPQGILGKRHVKSESIESVNTVHT